MPEEETDQQYDASESAGDHRIVEPASERKIRVNHKKIRDSYIEEQRGSPVAIPFELPLNTIQTSSLSPPILTKGGTSLELAISETEFQKVNSSEIQLLPFKFKSSLDLKPRPFTLPKKPEINSEEIHLPELHLSAEPRISPLAIDPLEINPQETGLPPRRLLTIKNPEENLTSTSESEETSSTETATDTSFSKKKKPEEESLPDIFDILFEITGDSVTKREPICIIASKKEGEEYSRTLQTLCREQFRQLVGGRPRPELLAEDEQQKTEELLVQNRIISLDDSEEEDYEFFDFTHKIGGEEVVKTIVEGKADLSKLYNRVDEFFSQGLGYLLLHVDSSYSQALYQQIRESVRESVNVSHVSPTDLSSNVKRKIMEMAWGHVSISEEPQTLDEMFHAGEEAFKSNLEPSGQIKAVTDPDRQGMESELHFWIKCFVVNHLVDKHGLEDLLQRSRPQFQEKIPTEYQRQGPQDPVADIFDTIDREVYEVETLFEADTKKIDASIDKYEGTNVKKVNVIIPNLTLLRNIESIQRRDQKERGVMYRLDVDIWTLDLQHKTLVPLDKVMDSLREHRDYTDRLKPSNT